MRLHFSVLLFLIVGSTSAQKAVPGRYRPYNEFMNYVLRGDSMNWQAVKMLDSSSSSVQHVKDTLKITQLIRMEGFTLKSLIVEDTATEPNCFYSHFELNGKPLRPDTNANNCWLELLPAKARKTKLNDFNYLLIPSWAPDCTVASCKLGYNHLFQIKNDSIKYYEIMGMVNPPEIFGDLNKDGRLDRISLTGGLTAEQDSIANELSKTEPEPSASNNTSFTNYFNMQALSLSDKGWAPITDAKGKAYYLFVEVKTTGKQSGFRLIKYHWFNDL